MEFTDRVALVTGSTAGIGREVASLLAAAGAAVVVTGRDEARGAATVAAIEADGGRAEFVRTDMGDLGSVRALAEAAGEVDVLVNNAGIFPFTPTAEQDPEGYQELFDVNVRAPFFLTAALLPGMAERGRGAVVTVSTSATAKGFPGAAAYAATKGALESLTRTWAVEYAGTGVRVNTVSPGPTGTDNALALLGDGAAAMVAGVPLRRLASSREIAETIVFLASERASYVHGATLFADGGQTIS
ncbi:SDR family NAD(P)-dependent oxidoreductase [Saccharothrix sp. Mg75]|uniref:SDR family NAD(P)-dependent oxidoreductase n=1 Tax=Saccharothrix sp. Mg75 TaxID=3445357 RepID=UPI003EEC2404